MIKIITASKGLRSKINFGEMKDRLFYVSKSEANMYRDKGLSVIEIPDNLSRSQVRRLIIENEKEPFFMIDDDIDKFSLYKSDTSYETLTPRQACDYVYERMIKFNMLEKVIVDIGNMYARFSCDKECFRECAVVFKAFYINPKILKELNINFPDYESQDDVELCLQLWELGKNIPVKYSLIKPHLKYEKDKDSATWQNNKRTIKVCETYLRWGRVISLAPMKNGYEYGLRVKVSSMDLRKISEKILTNGFNWNKNNTWDKTPDPIIKDLIEKGKYKEVYEYVSG
jgi:hypothetical protein